MHFHMSNTPFGIIGMKPHSAQNIDADSFLITKYRGGGGLHSCGTQSHKILGDMLFSQLCCISNSLAYTVHMQ